MANIVAAIERIFILVVLGLVLLVLFFILGCAPPKKAAVPQPARVPVSCLSYLEFEKLCTQTVKGFRCPDVQFAVKADPICNEFNSRVLKAK